jgi:PEP-CTERM motif
MNKILLLTSMALAISFSTQAQSTIADWTFETSQPTTAGPVSPETGAGSATGSHSGSATYSSPAGNGSSHSFSANTWATGDYWQYQVSTTGDSAITLSYDQTGSATGPKSFQLEYSLTGVNGSFININSAYNVLVSTWSPSSGSSSFTTTVNLSTVTSDAVDNEATLFLRFVDESAATSGAINGGNVGTAGTDRMDNVVIMGTPEAVPEPSTIALFGMGGAACLGFFRRLKK